ncbi:hypothetical protein PTQ19_07545 [Microbacterium esteraromaticum]|uniref:hypothetical protein n=1 Tax=Microbacterium esteraromaticum TaxID=57043 RepID=UPI002367AB81|nr:hypothetical protein [Microbacterium esteraromaticum]WDH77405.1 hypothetical protein PTQ19_07545 [Microbacterium esteraromaticum]
MDWFDEAVGQAAPPALGADPAAAAQADALARSVASVLRQRRLGSRVRRILTGSALSLGIIGLGVTAATAAPAVIDWFGWTPDIVAQRSFQLEDGTSLGLCEVFIGVEPYYDNDDVPDEEIDRRTEEARKFLTEHDWDPLIASITTAEIEAAYELEVERRVAFTDPASIASGATPPPATYSIAATRVIADRVNAEFRRAGHLIDSVSLQFGAGPCDGATEGPTQ